MSMREQMVSITRSVYYHLACINKIRQFLNQAICVRAVLSLVMTRLDYCNALLLGQSRSALHGLQVAQNSAARVITRTSRRQHITPVLKDLHWLPVYQRIKYKTLCLLYKALYSEESPGYLTKMLTRHQVARSLRSGSDVARLDAPGPPASTETRALPSQHLDCGTHSPVDYRGNQLLVLLKVL